jgi:hypothetical protein
MSIFLGSVNSDYDNIINELNKKNSIVYENQGWFALANKNNKVFYIIFEKSYWTFTKKSELTKYYKNAKSWAKRVSQLTRKGF